MRNIFCFVSLNLVKNKISAFQISVNNCTQKCWTLIDVYIA